MPQNYPILRGALRPEYAEAADDVVETVVAELYGPGVSAAEAEEFLGGIGRAFGDFGRGVANVAKQAAPVLGNALPGALSGAATGAALGPWGALAGAAIGGVTSAISGATAQRPGAAPRGGGARPRGGAGGALGQIAGIAGPALQGLSGMGGTAGTIGRIAGMAMPAVQSLASGNTRAGVGQLIGAAGSAIGAAAPGGVGGQIAGLLARPEVQQAITSQMLGPFGRDQVSVGGTPVPTGAVMNMLGSLFNQAATSRMGAPGESEAMPAYLMTAEGEFAVDPADPDARGQWLAQLIAATPRPAATQRRMAHAEHDEGYAEGWDEDYADYDELGEYDEFDEHDEVAVSYSLADLDEYDDASSYRG